MSCKFCEDCDALRCPYEAKVVLFRIAESIGKKSYWNSRVFLAQLTLLIDQMQREELAGLPRDGERREG